MDWKTPVSREEYATLTQVSRVAKMRGQFKAVKRHTKLLKRDTVYRNRAEEAYQTGLGLWYKWNF